MTFIVEGAVSEIHRTMIISINPKGTDGYIRSEQSLR